MTKIGRNQPCPCGSGLKYKKCHSAFVADLAPRKTRLDSHEADEKIRQSQQGLGRPIVGARMDGYQIVAVGNTIHWSKKWKTFPDFLHDYIKRKIGPEWGNAEIVKPFEFRHPLMQWYDVYAKYQAQMFKQDGEVHSSEVTGVVAAYLGTAYALYLLDHNAELQARFINRLKDIGNFQGAYYELIVASILIRAGFALTLEDEGDGAVKHCEFAAVSETTGKRYWVEAKMRSVAGQLGRTAADGGKDGKLLAKLIPHLNAALAKPAQDERLIFIDLNTPLLLVKDGKPDWLEPAMDRLSKYEQTTLASGVTAYVFVTNMAFHRQLEVAPSIAAWPFGLGMPEFNRPGMVSVSEAYRRKRNHIDAYRIGESIEKYLRFPATFDGKVPSEAFGQTSARLKIGEAYLFEDIGEGGTLGTVTSVAVDEQKKEMFVGVTKNQNKSVILKSSMSDAELAEYREFGDAYFGQVSPQPRRPKDNFQMFEWLMEVNKNRTKANMLAFFAGAPRLAEYEAMSDDDLRLVYCEAHIAAINEKSQ
ncbi:SEC-C domain-containing protein [Mesorhizobium sp. M0018]|uniref:YecA family protein n=1 Tax=unclassified Mesorhizobium TaxID=325217 RepID=UPI00333A7FA3